MGDGRWKLGVGSWELEVGSWELGVGSWKLEVGRLIIGRNLKLDPRRSRIERS